MLKKILAVTAVAAAIPAAASAQQVREVTPYAGVSVGYHQLEEIDADDFGGTDDVSIDGFTYGGYAGVHVPLGETLVTGIEGNFNLGTGTLDSEYGATAHLGTMIGENSMLFARAGYQ
ncbi:MAG: opacity protein, partial [Pacificimonas sp.]